MSLGVSVKVVLQDDVGRLSPLGLAPRSVAAVRPDPGARDLVVR